MNKKIIENIFPFLEWMPRVKDTWKNDLVAGLTGMVIVIPQAVAFAMIAGLPPIYGFYTAMITPIIAAMFGSSHHLISGPTTAMSIVVFATISKFVDHESNIEAFVALTLTLTLMAGIIQFIMGVIRMGKLVNFVSHSVIVGFTAGAAVLIAFKQIKHIFDLELPNGSNIYGIIKYMGLHISESNLLAVAVGVSTLIMALILRKFLPKLYLLLAIIFGTVLSLVLGGEGAGIKTIDEVVAKLPSFSIPDLKLNQMNELLTSALVLALLGLIEAVAISKSIALKSHQKIDSSKEFIGQGLSNIIGSMFSSYAGSGSFTRSGINYQSGAQTPMSAVFAAVSLGIVLLLIAPWASYLPKPAMGGVILLVAYNLIDFEHIKRIYKSSKRELIVFGVTFLGTILFKELELALVLGMMFSLLFYMERTSRPNIATMAMNDEHNFINIIRDDNLAECPQLKIIRIDGSIYFGALENIQNVFNEIEKNSDIKNILIVAHGVNFIDLAGAEWMAHEAKKWKAKGGGIYFVGSKIISQDVLRKGGFMNEIGHENFFTNKTDAINQVFAKLNHSICESCDARVFKECSQIKKVGQSSDPQ